MQLGIEGTRSTIRVNAAASGSATSANGERCSLVMFGISASISRDTFEQYSFESLQGQRIRVSMPEIPASYGRACQFHSASQQYHANS